MVEEPLNGIESQAELIRMRAQLEQAFSPGAPVRRIEFLAGRTKEMGEALRAVSRAGMHAVLYGERGVGKTSIARFIHEMWTDIAKDISYVIPPYVSCDSDDTFQTVWANVAREVQLIIEQRLIDPGNDPESGAFRSALDDLETGEATPGVIRRALDLPQYRFIVVIDEFDRLSDLDASRLFADTIKMLSDHLVDATLILVGVADSLEELIHEHRSIDRSIIQVLVPRMDAAELKAIVVTGLTQVGMSIEEHALNRIAAASKGLPHFTHLLGLESAIYAVEQEQTVVRGDDFDHGLARALDAMKETLGSHYHRAIMSPRKDARYAEVLLASALAPVDELGYFAPADLREPITAITGEQQDIPNFMRHLSAFCEGKRGKVLQRSDEHTRPRYRFSDTLMQPYVLLRGLSDGIISEELARATLDP